MPNCSIHNNRKAFKNLDLGTSRTGISDFKSHHVSHDACLAPNYKQVLLMCALDYDIAQDAQHAFGRRSDIEPGIASATGHIGLKSASPAP
jgi:hypothetical protein